MTLRIKFEPILPESGLDFPTQQFERFVKIAEADIRGGKSAKLKALFKKRTTGWETQVNFAARVVKKSNSIGLTVFPRGAGKEVWNWVSEGTRQHDITPKNKKVLAFPAHYGPHTRPGNRFGGSGLRTGPTVIAMKVRSGIEAREFEKHIRDEFEEEWERNMERAMKLSNRT